MNMKNRLFTLILAGILVGLLGARIQRMANPLDVALVSYDDAVRKNALSKFQKITDGAKKSDVIGALYTKRATDADPRIRVFALYALRKSGWAGPRVVGAMVRGVKDKEENVRKEATVGLMEIGQTGLSAMIDMMGDPAVRGATGEALKTLPPESVAQLAGLLNKSTGQQLGAVFVISKLRNPATIEKAKELTPVLSQMLKSTDSVLATNAAFAIHNLNPEDPRPIDVFLASLKKPNWDDWGVRGWEALEVLTAQPSAAPRTIATIHELFPKAEDGLVKFRRFKRPAFSDALAKLAPRDTSLPARVADFKSKDVIVRWRAVYGVSISPQVDTQFMAPLVGLLNDPDMAVAARAFYALDRMGMKNTERAAATVNPKLIETFGRVSGVQGFWVMAAQAIAGLGAPMVPLTLDAVKNKKLEPFKGASIMVSFSKDAPPVDALRKALSSDNKDVRIVAAAGLSKLAPETPGVREELERQVQERPSPFKDEIAKRLAGLKR